MGGAQRGAVVADFVAAVAATAVAAEWVVGSSADCVPYMRCWRVFGSDCAELMADSSWTIGLPYFADV